MPQQALTTLAQHIDEDFSHEAYRRTRKDGASGIDGQTAEAYEAKLEANLKALLARFKSGRYRAPAVRRVHIPKGEGTKTRAIGIPTFEDKALPRAVAMVLEAIYEQRFHDGSYGVRPGRSAHQALETLWKRLMEMGGGIVVDVDIQAFFDTLDHTALRGCLDQRVRDGVLRRTIDKWLDAGVLEKGALSYPESGTPQGGVISPLLANIYLDEVLDRWFEAAVKPRLRGAAFLVRYADDFVLVFASARDAQRVLAVLGKRFATYALAVHPQKTRVLDFRRPQLQQQAGKEGESFQFLGFTHYWGRSRKGRWVVQHKTASQRMSRALKAVAQWCKESRQWSQVKQHPGLSRKLRGHFAYYGITGNVRALERFHHQVVQIWFKWLNRRGGQRRWTWGRYERLLRLVPLPEPIVVHSVLRHAARP